MGWVRMDDKRADHPKLMAAGFAARGLDEACIEWCAGHETDGHIPDTAVAMLAAGHAEKNWKRLAGRLVDVGRWERNGTGWHIHDYLDFNPSKADLAKTRAGEADRKRRQREHGAGSVSHDDTGRFATRTPTNVPPGHPPGHQAESGRSPTGSPAHVPAGVPRYPSRPVVKAAAAALPTLKPPPSDTSRNCAAAPNLAEEACRILARRRLDTAPPGTIANPAGYLRSVTNALHADHAATIAALDLTHFPTAEHLADRLEPPTPKRADPLEATAQAAATKRDSDTARTVRPCPDCDGTRWAETATGATPCPACHATGTRT